MSEVRLEAEALLQHLGERLGQFRCHLSEFSARLANEVLVHASGSEVIDARGVAKMRVTDDAGVFKGPERSVHGRWADGWEILAHARYDVLSGRVSR